MPVDWPLLGTRSNRVQRYADRRYASAIGRTCQQLLSSHTIGNRDPPIWGGGGSPRQQVIANTRLKGAEEIFLWVILEPLQFCSVVLPWCAIPPPWGGTGLTLGGGGDCKGWGGGGRSTTDPEDARSKPQMIASKSLQSHQQDTPAQDHTPCR